MTDSTLDERFGGVLVPDAMLPSQFFGSVRRGATQGGERRLMVAVLEDALHCFQKYVDTNDPRQQQLFQDAEKWISADHPTWFFSFPNVCETLDIDPTYVREGLFKWRDARRRAAASRPAACASGTDGGADDELEAPPLRRANGA